MDKEHSESRKWLDAGSPCSSTWEVRRSQRQLLRKWAKKGPGYGWQSHKTYCHYMLNHTDVIGGLTRR